LNNDRKKSHEPHANEEGRDQGEDESGDIDDGSNEARGLTHGLELLLGTNDEECGDDCRDVSKSK